jgi:hypothetical protein
LLNMFCLPASISRPDSNAALQKEKLLVASFIIMITRIKTVSMNLNHRRQESFPNN